LAHSALPAKLGPRPYWLDVAELQRYRDNKLIAHCSPVAIGVSDFGRFGCIREQMTTSVVACAINLFTRD